MTSTITNRPQGVSVRSSPRFSAPFHSKTTSQTPSQPPESPINEPPQQTSIRQEDDICPKPPREPPTTVQALPATSSQVQPPPRRLTRSTIQHFPTALAPSEVTPPAPIETPPQETPTPPKTAPPPAAQEQQESPLRQPLPSCKKLSRCVSEQPSPYAAVRKNYRKSQRKELTSIPYRKCHEAFEGRIVGLLNKVEGGKNCAREIEGLAERLQRAGSRELLNRHVVAGVRVLLRLARQRDYDVTPKQRQERTLERLEEEEKRLKLRIEEELDRCDQFTEEQQEWSPADCREHRDPLIRRLYVMIRRARRSESRESAREEAVGLAEKIIGEQRGLQRAITLLRSQGELPTVNIN